MTTIGGQNFVLFGSWHGADRPPTRITPSTTVKLAAGAWLSFSREAEVMAHQLGPRNHPLAPAQPVPGGPSF